MIRRLALLLALLVPAACGGGTQDRPVVVATFPAQGGSLPGLLAAARITFDGPVRLLNPAQVASDAEGIPVPVFAEIDPTDPQSILVRPQGGWTFLPGREHRIRVSPGLVANTLNHYMLENFDLYFVLGRAETLFLASPGTDAVVEADVEDLAAVNATPTPAGRDPVAVVGTNLGGTGRLWVQLGDDGGVGEALAWFAPGDLLMSTVTLSREAGSSLLAAAPAAARSRDGSVLYLAYRDDGPGTVRVHRVDARTASEVPPAVVLSVAPSPTTAPLGMALGPSGDRLFVACRSAAGDRLAEIDTRTFLEVDRGPDAGTDGIPLPAGAGPIAALGGDVLVAPAGATAADLTQVGPTSGTVVEHPSALVGVPSALVVTREGLWAVEGLSGYLVGEALAVRSGEDLGDLRPFVVSDAVGGSPTLAGAVLHLALLPGEPRLLALLDSDVLATFGWTGDGLVQEDRDPVAGGVQALALPPAAAGATWAAFLPGVFPP